MNYRKLKSLLLKDFQISYFTKLLIKHKGNVTQASKEAGFDGANLRRLIRTLPIDIKSIRDSHASSKEHYEDRDRE